MTEVTDELCFDHVTLRSRRGLSPDTRRGWGGAGEYRALKSTRVSC